MKIKYKYKNAQLTEYVLAAIDKAPPEKRLAISSELVGKIRNPDQTITNMSLDEKLLLLGQVGISAIFILTDSTSADLIVDTYGRSTKEYFSTFDELKGDYYGEKNLFFISSTQALKYYHLVAMYQNSSRYFYNKNFQELIRSTGRRKRIRELQEEDKDITALIKIYNAPRKSRDYVSKVLKINPLEEAILMFMAEKPDTRTSAAEITKMLQDSSISRRNIITAMSSVFTRQFVHSFGMKEKRKFILSVNGWNIIRQILDKTMMEIHK